MALALTAKPVAVGLVALSPQVANAAGTVACTGNNATDVAALKAAIVAAVPGSTITLVSSCVFTLTAANSLGSDDGLPTISKKLVIEGNGATITRSANLATPRFRILHVASTGNLTLRHTTISNGSILGGGGGGGITNQGILAVEHSTITR
ncbi:MAG TPA: hypothetical protein VGR61_04315, partial [Candidatus Dormibacteraeota bacterium]|nr:hypothetical protein [Candidatus Dormibacteraeota bacterium]